MKRFIQISSFFLILTGFILTPMLLGDQEVIAWIHIMLGFAYIVAFLLFAYDHLSQNSKILLTLHPRNVTGMLQLTSGGLVLLSGFVIFLFDSRRIEFWSDFHFWTTIIFMCSLLFHFRSKKG